jgi:hypothetical protein
MLRNIKLFNVYEPTTADTSESDATSSNVSAFLLVVSFPSVTAGPIAEDSDSDSDSAEDEEDEDEDEDEDKGSGEGDIAIAGGAGGADKVNVNPGDDSRLPNVAVQLGGSLRAWNGRKS